MFTEHTFSSNTPTDSLATNHSLHGGMCLSMWWGKKKKKRKNEEEEKKKEEEEEEEKDKKE